MRIGNTADHQNQAVGVRRLETLRQFQVNFFGFSAPDVNSCLQATFDFVGKGQQRKRHDESRHRQPESSASGIMASLQAWHNHGRSTSFPGPPESNETTSVIGKKNKKSKKTKKKKQTQNYIKNKKKKQNQTNNTKKKTKTKN